MTIRTLRDWQKGNPLAADHWQEAVLALRELQGGTAYEGGGGDGPIVAERVLAVLTNAGPNGEGDFVDERYWGRVSYLRGSKMGDRLGINPVRVDAYGPIDPLTVPLNNLAEWAPAGGTHLLATDGTVAVAAWVLYDYGDPQSRHYLFDRLPAHTFEARITGRTQDGSNKRWTYTFTERAKTGAAWAGWGDKSGGRTGNCYNRIEVINGSSGLYGNGVDSANLTGTFDVQPVPTNTPVQLTAVPRGDTGAAEYWFSYENGVDGAC